MNGKTILMFLLLCVSVSVLAQKPQRVYAEYTYQSNNPKETPEQAEKNAILEARKKAIREKFAEHVVGQTDYIIGNDDGRSFEIFYQHGGTYLKADWVKTIKEEVLDKRFEQGFWIVSVYVEGMALEINSSEIDLDYHILRNGTELDNEDNRFKHRDRMYLRFKAPVDGYLAVYLLDDNKAYCVLPYEEQREGIYSIEANKEYVFFSERHALPDELSYRLKRFLTTDKDHEINELHIIFSKNEFVKKTDNDRIPIGDKLELLRNVDRDAYENWLYDCRKRDPKMRVIKETITIGKKNRF